MSKEQTPINETTLVILLILRVIVVVWTILIPMVVIGFILHLLGAKKVRDKTINFVESLTFENE